MRADKFLTYSESFRFLDAYKIPTIETRIARTTEEALAFASELGFPVIMKALNTQSTFNLEKGTIVCDVCSSSEVPIVFNQIVDKIYSGKSAEFQGIIIQPKTHNGIKLFLGLRKNNKFGSIIILGTRGDSSEIINNISRGFSAS